MCELRRVPAPRWDVVVKIVMRTAIVGCCDVQVVKAEGFNQELSLETGRRGYVCALHMDEWEGPGRSACRRLCITPVDWRLRRNV